MDTQKTEMAIHKLENRIEDESKSFEKIEEYNADKLMLENMKKELHDDASQKVTSDADIKTAVETSHSNVLKSVLQKSLEKEVTNAVQGKKPSQQTGQQEQVKVVYQNH